MPPPSPTRKQQLLPWTQQLRASPTRPAAEQLRRRRSSSSNSAMQSPEHTPTTTATYTAQFLRRRSSQHEIAAAHEEQQRRMTLRRHSSEDASVPTEQLNGSAGAQPQENGRQAGAADEKGLADLEMKEKPAGAAAPGKGTALNGGRPAAMDQDQNAAKRVAMAKERKAQCGRSAVVLAVLAGVVIVSVAGGIVLCRMYPTSPAAASIRMAVSRAEQELVELRGQAKPYTMAFGEAGLAKLLILLKSASLNLKKPARAAEELANELLDPSALTEAVKAATMCLAVAKDSRELLQLAISGLIDVLNVSAEWIQARVKDAIDSVEMRADSEAFEHARSALLTAVSSLSEVLEHGMELVKSSMDQVFEWIGLESGAIDGNTPSGEFLAPLVIDQTAIQAVARKLMTEQSRALEDVKRFEKRRVTIASVANSVIAETRAIALEGIVDAKMVAADFIKERTKELAEQYVQALEQALEEFELTSRQVEKEGGSQTAADVSEDTQAHVDTAVSLKRDLMLLAKAVSEKLSATQERTAYSDELTEEEPALEAPKSPAQCDGDLVNEDQRQAAADLTEEDQQHVELLSGTPSSPENAVESDGGNDETPLNGAVLVEGEGLTVEVASTGKQGLDGELKRTVVAEVVVDLEDVVVDVKHMEVEVVKIFDEHKESEVDVELQQEERVAVHAQVPGEGTGEELVEVDEVVAATTEWVDQRLPDATTRIAAQPPIGQEEEPSVEKDVDVAETVLSALGRIEEVELVSVRSDVEAATEGQTGGDVARVEANQLQAEDGEPEQDIIAATSREIQALETEQVVVAQELEGLEQLEQVLEEGSKLSRVEEELAQLADALQEEDKLVRVEELEQLDQALEDKSELARVEEELEQLEQALEDGGRLVREQEQMEQLDQIVQDEDKVTRVKEELEQLERVLQEESSLAHAEDELRAIAGKEEIWLQSEPPPTDRERTTAKIDETTDAGTYAQVGLLAAVLLALAAYLLARHYKRVRFARAPPRRRRWKRLAELDESDTEEVVLLPDSSDEEEDVAVAAPKERSLEVTELVSSVRTETTVLMCSGGEEADAEEETSESHEEELDEKEEEESEPVSMSTRSRTVVAKTTTYTVDHPATSSSDASADDGGNPSVPATPPAASRQATPDTSERSRRRRREIRS